MFAAASLYFANISFGVVLKSDQQKSTVDTDEVQYKNDDDYLKYHNRSSAWLTIIDDNKPEATQTLGKNGKKSTKFASDFIDNATTLANRGTIPKATGNNSENTVVKKSFYKTLPKAFKRDDKMKPIQIMGDGSLGGSQESLQSRRTIPSSSSSSSSTSSLHNIAPNRPPPPPPINRRNSGVNNLNGIPPATLTRHLTASGGAPSREQMFLSLLTSVFGFFSAKFHLTWLLLFYSIYITTGLVLWLYNHAFIYRRVRHLSYSEQTDYIRRSSASRALGLAVSAPSQSLGLSSALDLTKVCDNMYDEVHLQMLASRRDAVDMGLKIILIMSAYDLSNSL